MKIFFNDKIYNEFVIINKMFFIKNEQDIIKCRNIYNFEIECIKCLSKIKIKKI